MRATAAIALLAIGVGAAPALAQSVLPAGEGRDIVAVACTQCHALTPLFGMRDGPVGWKRHVYNMVLRGAQLDQKDIDTVLAYLTTNFGPGQALPPANPVALAEGAGKELVATRCVLCHDLERVTAAKREKRAWPVIVNNMFERFGLSAPDEAAAISSYLSAHYASD
jgi:mono/diheme cytochrome c family protein